MRPLIAARTLKIIAVLQILGGVLGAVLAAVVMPQLAAKANVSVLRLLPWFVLPFALSLTAGILLWRRSSAGEILSLINLALQIPVISTPLLSYFFNSGLALRIWYGPEGVRSFVFLGSQFHLSFTPEAQGVLIGANVVAGALLVVLIRAMPDDGDSRAPDTSGPAHSA